MERKKKRYAQFDIEFLKNKQLDIFSQIFHHMKILSLTVHDMTYQYFEFQMSSESGRS